MKEVLVVPYSSEWQRSFELECAHLQRIYTSNIVHIYHIGSTAIKNCSAKPTIDILVELKDFDQVDTYTRQMHALGYIAYGEFGMEGRRFYCKGNELRTHHVHVLSWQHPAITRHIAFRDYLNAHSEYIQQYSQLKQNLAHTFPNNITLYMAGKSDFIQQLEQQALEWYTSVQV